MTHFAALLCFISVNCYLTMEPDFETLLREYNMVKYGFDAELSIAERNLSSDKFTVDHDIRSHFATLESLHNKFCQSWKRLLLTEEYYEIIEIDNCDLDQSYDNTQQKYQSLLSYLQARPSPDSVDPCITPSDIILPPALLRYIPPQRRTSSSINSPDDPCIKPSVVTPPSSPAKYIPPHRRSPSINPQNAHVPDAVVINMTHVSGKHELCDTTRRYTPPTVPHISNYAREEPECQLCPERLRHRLWNCPVFLEMKPHARLQFVLDHKLCHNCLLSSHETSYCGKKSVCSVPNCGMKHSKYIHVSGANCDLFTPPCSMKDSSVCHPTNEPAPSYVPSADFHPSYKMYHFDCDEKLRNMQLMIEEMNCLLVSVVEKLHSLKSYVDYVYPGRNASVFTSDVLNSPMHSSYDPGDDQVTLERVNLQPGHTQVSDNDTAYVNSYCNDESCFDSTHSELFHLRPSPVT